MNEQQAKNLIKDTFEKPFEKSQFINFISNLLNLKQNEIINEHPYSGNYIPEAYRQYINSLYRIAKYEDDSEKKIDVLIVRLEKETSLERARSMQRNFIAWYLKGSRGGILKDAALVAFVSPDNDDWRFSFVKIQYLFKDNKAAEMLSSALRYSFLVGKNEISYTAQSQLIPFFLDDINKPSLEMLEQAFSVEKVSKKFFKEYEYLYMKALGEFNSNEVFTKVLEQNSNLSVDLFVRKLLGQIVFPYFLQKKGWLGIKIDKPGWKAGNRKFLRWTFEDCNKKDKNYFDRFLQPLFYAGFNKKEELFQYDEFQFKIPFLNGGLFEELFHWESTFINPANTLFSNKEIHKDGSIGTGILDIFDRYNFTIDENTAFEKEIAVDPEMLGKVFENLLPENLRKGKGTYYTPREIVAYMTKESLINYLTSKITPDDSDDKSKIEEKVRRLFDYKDLYINKKNKEIKKYGKEFENQFYEMLDIVEDVNKHLQAIKIVDPACGSGAFPMGILLEIVSLREYIENEFLDNKISNYKLKKETIQNSIYGVDIDPGAVEIAKLRFWLSLVVDAEEPEPLPNLDYKIMQGNSLIELISYESSNDLKRDKMVIKLKNLKDELFSTTSQTTKKRKREEINKIIKQLFEYDRLKEIERYKDKILAVKSQIKLFEDKQTNKQDELKVNNYKSKIEVLNNLTIPVPSDHFEWHINFSEVFSPKDGFDIVIANPPYLKERENASVFSPINKSELGKKYHRGKMDYWFYFLHKAINISKKNSIITYITSRYWLNSDGATNIIKHIKAELIFLGLVDIGKLKIFDNVVGQHMIASYCRSKIKSFFKYKKLINSLDDINSKKNTENIIISSLNNNDVFQNNEILLTQQDLNISNSIPLASVCKVSQGVVEAPDKFSKKMIKSMSNSKNQVGDGVFVLNKSELSSLCLNQEESKIIKKYLDPNDVSKYSISFDEEYLIYSDKEMKKEIKTNSKYNRIKNHLDKFRSVITSSNAPYGLHRPRERKYFDSPKIIFKNMFKEIGFCYDEEKYFFGFSFSSIIQDDKKYNLKYILSILNSKFAQYWFYKYGKLRGVGVDIGVKKLRKFPIKKNETNQQSFIKIVDQILTDKKAGKDTQMLEDKIDLMVYKLYGLTYEEVTVVAQGFDKVLNSLNIIKHDYKNKKPKEIYNMFS